MIRAMATLLLLASCTPTPRPLTPSDVKVEEPRAHTVRNGWRTNPSVEVKR